MRLALVALASLVSSCADLTASEPLYPPYVPDAPEPRTAMHVDGVAHEERDFSEPLGPPYPIIMVHGFSGWNDVGPVEYFFQVRDHLAELGHDVITPALPPYTTSLARAQVLADVIDETLERTGKAKVHLVGHSQGGMDIRVVVGSLGYNANEIATITTISTPHDGTAVADLAMNAPEGVLNPAGQLLGWLVGALEGEPPDEAAWADDETSDAWTPELASSIAMLSTEGARSLVQSNAIPEDIPFFTVAGVSNLRSLHNTQCSSSLWARSDSVDDTDPLFVASGLYLSFTEDGDLDEPWPNDGLVTVASARAPESTFLGCVPADHVDEIGQIADVFPGLISGWDHLELYERIVENLRQYE